MLISNGAVLNSAQSINESQQEVLRTRKLQTLPQSIELTQLVVQVTQTFRDYDQLLRLANDRQDLRNDNQHDGYVK